MLWDHFGFSEQLKCCPPSFLWSAPLGKACLLPKPTEAEVAIECEPVAIAVQLILMPDIGTFYAC